KESRRVGAEIDVSESLPRRRVPAAVLPRSHDNDVKDARVLFFDSLICVQRPVEILGIEPASHCHYRGSDFVEMGKNVARLPVLVIVGVLDDIIPQWYLALELALIDMAERAEIEEKLVAVRRADMGIKSRPARHWFRTRLAKNRQVPEHMR